MKKSFTLIEVILAVSILTLAVGGSFALIQQTLLAASQNQSKLIAYYLAQEGIEVVRNIRDSNWLEQRARPSIAWDNGLADGDYIADYLNSDLIPFENKPLNFNSEGFYSYSGDTQTKFKRKITVTKINDDTLKVSIGIEWVERGRTNNIGASEYLYNWYGY